MAYNDYLVTGVQSTSPVLTSVAAGADGAGATLLMSRVALGSLSATVTVDAETDTITLTPVWQVSNDASTWIDARPSNAAANVALATGTSSPDAAVTAVVSAPAAAYGFRYARCNVRVGVTTGTANDTATIAYNYASASATA